jgi:O-Antigen ligase
MGMLDRILFLLLVVLVAWLPFEFRSYPLVSNLQWLFAAASAAALPIMIRDRQKLLRNGLVLAAILFVFTQWLAALLAPEFRANAIKGAVRMSAALTLLCATLCVRDRRGLLQVWNVSAVLAALYGILDYSGFGAPSLFRETDFYRGSALRLSGSFEYPNTAAAFFAMSLPVFWITAKAQWFRILGSLLIWAALILTYSRGAMFAAFLMLLAWAWMSRSPLVFMLGALSLGIFVSFLVFHPVVLERFQDNSSIKAFSAEYDPEFNVLRRPPDELDELMVRVKNNGTTTWSGSESRPFTLSYWWNDPERGKFLHADTIYTPIPMPVRPHESVTLRASFRTPHEPGLYLLTWDISQSGSNWFSGMGVFPGLVEIDVRPEKETWSGNADLSRWHRREITKLFVANVPFSRSELWNAAFSMAYQHPILGVGPGNFRLLYGRPFGVTQWDTKIRANSLYLELLSGSGIVGLAAFGVMMAAAMWKTTRKSLAPMLAIGVLLIHGVVDDFMMTTPIYFAFWILLAQTQESDEGAPARSSLRA